MRDRLCRARCRPAAVAAVLALLGTTAQAQAPESYRKSWSGPAVAARIERNIEKHRKGDATITVVGRDGKPVAEASVEVQQQTHEFLFGCNAFVLGQLKPEELERRYEEAFVKLFNFATVPFYWAGTEPTKGELRYAEPTRDIWRRPPPDGFVPWAAKSGVALKGHPLLWHAHNPSWLPKDANELRELYRKRFREIAERFGGKIGIWDVVNESLVCPKSYTLFAPDRDYVRWAFQEAAALFPEQTTLMINDVTGFSFPPASDRYFGQVKALLAQGAKVRGIGFQFHYFRREALDKHLAGSNCNPGKMLDVYEQFGDLGLPLYITEITIPSAGAGGDELQAQVVRDHYRLWFSAPRMAGITWWNLGDGTAVQGENEAKGGLMDAELRPKPAYAALDRLINQEWKTRVAAKTDANGVIRFRGFYGKYAVKVTVGAQTQEFSVDLARAGQATFQLTLKP